MQIKKNALTQLIEQYLKEAPSINRTNDKKTGIPVTSDFADANAMFSNKKRNNNPANLDLQSGYTPKQTAKFKSIQEKAFNSIKDFLNKTYPDNTPGIEGLYSGSNAHNYNSAIDYKQWDDRRILSIEMNDRSQTKVLIQMLQKYVPQYTYDEYSGGLPFPNLIGGVSVYAPELKLFKPDVDVES